MNKLFSKIAALSVGLAMAVGVGVALGHEGVREVRAEDVLVGEAVFNATNNSKGVSSYTDTWTNTTNGFEWSLVNFNNNNNQWSLVKCGRKKYASVASISSQSVADVVSKVTINISAISDTSKVNSIKLYGGSDGTTEISSFTVATGEQSISIPAASQGANQVYKIEFDCASNTANGIVSLSGVSIFKESGDPSQDTLVVKLNDATESPLALDYSPTGSWLFYANDKDGNDINSEWSSSDESVFTVSKNGNNVAVVVPHNPGTANLVASADGFNDGVFVLTVNAGELESLEVTGSMSKTSYFVGQSWNPEGLVATGSYDTGYVGDITSEVEWSYNPATPTTSVTSVVATATVGTVSGSSASQSVTVTKANQIQEVYTRNSGSVDVYGYYVGYLTHTKKNDSNTYYDIIIQDGEYGIMAYEVSSTEPTYTEKETVLHVTGTISIYSGLYEVKSPVVEEATSIPEEKAPSAPVIYAAKGEETAEYASRLTTVTGTATVTSGSFDSAAGSSDIKMNFTVGAQTIQVFYKKAAQTADAETFAAMKAAVTDSTEITVKGFTSWYNGFQVQMNGYVPAAEGYTAEQFAQDLLNQTDAVCAGWKEGDNNHDALVAIWSNLAAADKYPSLPSDQKTILAEAERDEEGTVVEQAMARYDFLTGKYELSNFINGRTPIQSNYNFAPSFGNNNSYIIIIVISAVSVMSFGLALFLRKKRSK